MFILDEKRVVAWPVDVEKPIDGGETRIERFTGHFVLMTQSEIDAVVTAGKTDRELLRAALVGWGEDVAIKREGSDKAEAWSYSEARRDQMIDLPFVRRGLMRAYTQCLNGAPAKNSDRPPAGGPAAAVDPAATTKSSPT